VISEELAFLLQKLIPALNEGVLMSIQLSVPSAVLGLALGVGVGSLRAYGGRFLSPLANGYAALFRGTPLVIQLFILYFGLPNIGIYFKPYTAAVLGFIMCSAAYHSEYIRGGLLSIRRGQVLAAQALGFSTFRTLVWIIIPQAFRRALPGCGNEIVYLIKYSSLAYVVTCFELTGQAKIVASETFRFSEVFMVVGVYYLALVTVASWGLRRLEKRLEIPGFGH
jgi:polar amino acid transport system permease protein